MQTAESLVANLSYMAKIQACVNKLNNFERDEWIDSPLGTIHIDNANWLVDQQKCKWMGQKLIAVDVCEYAKDKNGREQVTSSTWGQFIKRIAKGKNHVASEYNFMHPTNDEIVTFIRTKTFKPYIRRAIHEI